MLKATDIANYFLSLADYDSDECISNLKLQKLCYYAQGFHLAIYNKRLFNETMQAWQHGPVVPSLYHNYKNEGASCLRVSPEFDINIIPQKIRDLLDDIYNEYGQYSAWKLREMTHNEEPWIKSYNKKTNDEISDEVLKDFFQTRLA